jgi:hypothetical protein
MAGKFKNSAIRLRRADDHLASFQAEWNTLAQNRFGSVCRYDRDSGWYIASLTASDSVRESVRNTPLPLILGEFAYQLRAALDALMWDAITLTQGAEPPADANRIEFPVLNGKIRKFENCGFHDFPFPKKLKVWLESIQPGSASKPLDHPEIGLTEALEDVHNLARFDRHRRLRIIASMPTELYADFVFVPPNGFRAIGTEGLPCNILGDQYDLFRFKVESATGISPEHISIITSTKFEVFFEDIPAVKDTPSGTRLSQLGDAVGYVIERFEKEFA